MSRLFKPEQLATGSYSISGSFSGSFFGDGGGLTNLPQEILKYSSSIAFPSPSGSADYLYLDQSANLLYAWDTNISQYVLLNSSTTAPATGSEGELYFADLATTAQLALNTYNNGVSGSGATLTGTSFGALGQINQVGKIDNQTPLVTDIILVKNEITAQRFKNGLYEITDLGSPSSSYVLTRVDYYDTGSEIYPSQITVQRGTVNTNQSFIQKTVDPIVGTSSIVFQQAPNTATQILPTLFIDTVTTGPLPASTYATGSGYVNYPGYQATITANVNGPLGVIGGVTASSNTRILVVSESNPINNGTYVVTAPGTATTKWRLQRLDYWSSMQPQFKEYVVSRFGATEYGSRYVLQSSSINAALIGISQSLVFQKYLSPGGGSATSFIQGGNSFGTTATLGTNDTQNLAFETSGSVRITISSSGNVGIGTPTPTTLLDINGGTRHRGSVTMDPGTSINWTDTSSVLPTSLNNRIRWTLNNDSAEIYAFQTGSDKLDLVFKLADNVGGAAGEEFVYWIDSVNGESADSYTLLMGQDFIVNPLRRYAVTSSNTASGNTDFYILQSGSTSLSQVAMFVDVSTSRVGIGTVSPSAKLDVSGSVLISNALHVAVQTTANAGSTTIYSLPTSSYDGAWFDYVARSGSNARAGQITSIWSGSQVNFTETTTTDFGTTTDLSLGVFVLSGNMALTASAATSGWTIKTIVRSI